MRTTLFRGALFFMLTAVVTACGGGDGRADSSSSPGSGHSTQTEATEGAGTSHSTGATEKVNLLIDFFANGNHALFYVARDNGYYAQEGLDVTIDHILGGAEVVKSLTVGQAQFGYADLATMAVSKTERESDLLAVMGIQQQTPMATLAREGAGVKSPADLSGKKIVDFAGSSTQIVWPVFLEENGLAANDLDLELVDPGSRLSLVVQGQADAAILFYTDNLPTMRQQCDCEPEAILWRENGINTLSNGIIVSGNWLAENGHLVERFVRATVRALEFATQNPEEAADIFLEANPDITSEAAIVAETIANSSALARTPNNADLPLGAMAEEDWRATLALMHRAGQMKQVDDPAPFYTNDFIPGNN